MAKQSENAPKRTSKSGRALRIETCEQCDGKPTAVEFNTYESDGSVKHTGTRCEKCFEIITHNGEGK